MTTDVSTWVWLAEAQAECHQAIELLQTGHYQLAAELLHQAQRKNEQKGYVILAEILAAIRLLCLACGQCQSEVAWHERASKKAGEHERELKQQLYAILELIEQSRKSTILAQHPPASPTTVTSLPQRQQAESAAYQSFWQRMQNLLGWASNFQRVEGGVTKEATAATPAKLAKKAKVPPIEDNPEQWQPAPSLLVHCLGSFRVYRNGQLIDEWHSLKGQAIFKYLVVHQETPITKDILMDVFWPEADPEAARRNLHQAIYSLRQTLKQDQPDFQPVQFENDCYLLNPEMNIWLDCEKFEGHAQAGERLEVTGHWPEAVLEYSLAEELYLGDFLEEDLYEEWTHLLRGHYRNIYLDLVDCLSEYYLQQGEVAMAIALCQKVLTQDNCHEQAHRRLMQCYQIQGQRRLAVRQYRLCVQTLKTELDVPPSAETQTLYERIMGSRRSLVLAN